jgi:hypothetical protein
MSPPLQMAAFVDNVLPVLSPMFQCVSVSAWHQTRYYSEIHSTPFVLQLHYIVGKHGRIKAKRIMRCSTVVNKYTAGCDIVHGSSRSEIGGETIMRRSAVVKKEDKAAISDVGSTERQGFQHVYKSNNTTLSRRVHSANNLSMQNGYPRNK